MKRTREDKGYRMANRDKDSDRKRRDESVGRYRALRSRLREDEGDE